MPFPMTAVIIATDYHFVILPIMTIILYSNITATCRLIDVQQLVRLSNE
jgi:hypothetical protein